MDQYTTILGAAGASIRGLRIGSTYEAQHFAVDVHGAAVTISNNTLAGPSYAGVYLEGAGTSLVRANVFHSAGYGVYALLTDSVVVEDNDFIEPSLPMDINELPGNTIVRGNRIVGGGMLGIHVQGGTPLIENNSFNKPGGYATYGAIRCAFSNAKPKVRNNLFVCALALGVADGTPDLGTAGDLGLNDFASVTGAAVNHAGSAPISAIGNTWQHSPPTASVDIIVTGTGSVRWGTGAGEIVP